MTKNAWCRALPRLSLCCALYTGCGDDGASSSTPDMTDTTAAEGDDDTAGTTVATDDDTTDSSTDSSTGDEGSEESGGAALEIVGEWIEVFPGGAGMQTHTITEETWAIASEFGDSLHHIESWDARDRVLVAQSDAANAFNPELWGKLEWQYMDGTLYYCQSVYDAETAEDAWAAPGAELADLDAGCGGFPWSPLDPA